MAQTKTLMVACAVVIAASMALGGGARGGLLSDVLLQLVGLPLLVLVLWRSVETNGAQLPPRLSGTQIASGTVGRQAWLGSWRWPLALLLAAALIPALQLVPIPENLQQLLPHGGRVAASRPAVSVAPHLTWIALLSLITPGAVFLATVRLPHWARRQLTMIIIVVGVVSVFIGLLQLAQGQSSKLRFYEITNDTEAVGFFANRNHFSALLYCLTLFAGAWALDYARTLGALPLDRRFETALFLPTLAIFTILVVLLGAQGMTRSRAGLGLTIVALMGVFALSLPDRGRVVAQGSMRSLWLVVGFAAALVGQFALYGILERFGSDPMADPRVVFARNTIVAAKSYMPFGSGVGTFAPVYGMFELPVDALAGAYVNRAHNDFLEIWLESGVFGIALIACFLVWLLARTVAIWRPGLVTAQMPGLLVDHALARAATLVIVLLLLHSMSDYPLRTGAMAAIFAFAVALLVPPPAGLELDAPDAGVVVKTSADGGKRQKLRASAVETPPVAAGAAVARSSRSVGGVVRQPATPIAWPEPKSIAQPPVVPPVVPPVEPPPLQVPAAMPVSPTSAPGWAPATPIKPPRQSNPAAPNWPDAWQQPSPTPKSTKPPTTERLDGAPSWPSVSPVVPDKSDAAQLWGEPTVAHPQPPVLQPPDPKPPVPPKRPSWPDKT
jgi:O-antigen ligase